MDAAPTTSGGADGKSDTALSKSGGGGTRAREKTDTTSAVPDELRLSRLTLDRFSTASKRRGFISPTSSFVDFAELESEYYTDEGRMLARYYDPHRHRQLKKPTTNFETCVHLLKGSVGAGLLAMPMAFKHAGVAVGVVLTLVLGSMCFYGMHTLIRMQYVQCKRLQVPFLTLPRSMKIALLNGPSALKPFAPIAPILVDFFLVTYQLGICTAYVIFVAESIKEVVEHYMSMRMDKRLYMLIILLPVVVINYIRNLKRLTPISLTSNILIVVSLCCCFYIMLFEGPFRLDDVEAAASPSTWPLFIGTVLFALEAVGVIIALEHNMEHPEQFLGRRGLFPWSLAFVVALYMSVGLVGYLKYGSQVKDTIIASLPKHNGLSLAVEAVYAACIYMTYPLQCYVSLEILWGNYFVHRIKDPDKECCIEYCLRTGVVLITFVLAIVIPHVDIMISLVGAFCLSTLGMIFPFVLELCTRWPDELGCLSHVLVKDAVFILVGFGVMVIGTYVSLYTLIQTK